MIFDSGSAYFLPQRAIGAFHATVTIEESSNDSLEITQHPVQQGATITDHAFVKPSTLSLKIGWTDDDAPLAETYQNLLTLQALREPFDVVTGKRAYTNMLMEFLDVTTDKETENILAVSMGLREVILTAVEVVAVPVRVKQANPGKTGATENAGQKSATAASEAQKTQARSALAAFAGQ
jgi:hypothetical protein